MDWGSYIHMSYKMWRSMTSDLEYGMSPKKYGEMLYNKKHKKKKGNKCK